MSGQWLQGLAIALPAVVLVCLLLERLNLGRLSNIATFGVLGVGLLMLAMLSVDKMPASLEPRLGSGTGAHLDIRMHARAMASSADPLRITEERILAAPPAAATAPAPSVAPAVALRAAPQPAAEQPASPPPPAPAACPLLPSADELERRCATQVATQTAALRDEVRSMAERSRQEAEKSRAELAALADAVRQREADAERARSEAERHRAALAEAQAALAQARATAPPPPPLSPAPVPAAAPAPTAAAAPVPPPAPVAAPPALPQHPLKQKLDLGITVAPYVLKPVPGRELVRGVTGSYYTIVLRNPADGKPLLFEPGGYSLGDRQPQLETAARRFRDDVLTLLGKDVPYRLYVQAFATSAKFARPRNLPSTDASLGTVSVLPRLGSDSFGDVAVRKSIASTYGNDDLPVLRAASVAAPLEKSLGEAVTILEGGIRSNTEGQNARTFEMVLFVKW